VHSGIKGGLRGKEDAFSDLHADRYLQLRPHAFQFRCQAEALHEMLREDRDGRDEVQFFSEGEEESDV
jgi:hypothetical protein